MTFTEFLEYQILNNKLYTLTVYQLLAAIAILVGAIVLWILISKRVLKPLLDKEKISASRHYYLTQIIKYAITILAILWTWQILGLTKILKYRFFESENYTLTVGKVVSAIALLLGARLLTLFIHKAFLENFFTKRKADIGRQYAITQFIKYVVYTLAFLAAFQVLGVQPSVIWGGATALLVGIGLGLQQTFNDLFSGLVLLAEGTVEVGDMIKVDGIVGTVKTIGIRTSKVETFDRVFILIPNSKLVSDNVINWSHDRTATRFQVSIGVAYGSDVDLVKKILLQVAEENESILKKPAPEVQFKDFGSSSLDFDLHFYSRAYQRIEFIRSDIRFAINKLFNENKIEIPFPQRDLWIRNPKDLK